MKSFPPARKFISRVLHLFVLKKMKCNQGEKFSTGWKTHFKSVWVESRNSLQMKWCYNARKISSQVLSLCKIKVKKKKNEEKEEEDESDITWNYFHFILNLIFNFTSFYGLVKTNRPLTIKHSLETRTMWILKSEPDPKDDIALFQTKPVCSLLPRLTAILGWIL